MEEKSTGTQVSNTTTPGSTVVENTTTVQQPHKSYGTKKVIFRTYQIIWYFLGVIEVLLGFRIVLKMLGANPYSGFTSFIYAVSDPLATPFRGILGTSVAQGSVMEWSTIIAGIVYAVIAYGIVHLIKILKPTTPQEVAQNIDN